MGDRDGAAFFASFDADTEEGRRGKARMLSVANGPALAWATAVPELPRHVSATSTSSLPDDTPWVWVYRYRLKCTLAFVEQAMQVDRIMQWHVPKHEERQRYATIYWLRPGVVPSVVQGAQPARNRPIAVLQRVIVATLACGAVTSLQ